MFLCHITWQIIVEARAYNFVYAQDLEKTFTTGRCMGYIYRLLGHFQGKDMEGTLQVVIRGEVFEVVIDVLQSFLDLVLLLEYHFHGFEISAEGLE